MNRATNKQVKHQFQALRWTVMADLPVQVLRMMQWSMMGLQLTVISKQWCALWCWADLSSGLNCRGAPRTFRRVSQAASLSRHIKKKARLTLIVMKPT